MDPKIIEKLKKSNFPFTYTETKDDKKWNELCSIPEPTFENFPHILRPCGSYPTGHPLNTIKGKLLFLGAPKEIFGNLTQTQPTQSQLDSECSIEVKTETETPTCQESNSSYYG